MKKEEENNKVKIDILSLDFKYKEKYKTTKKELHKYTDKLDLLKEHLKLKYLKNNIRNKLKSDIDTLEKFIEDIELGTSYNFYIMETSSIIDEYKSEIQKPIVIDFMSPKNINPENISTDHIVSRYLVIYKKYNKNFENIKILNNNCDICNSSDIKYEDNIKICIHCGNENNLLRQTSSYKDSERINIVPKYTYDRKSHFKDCLNQYQGKQEVNIPDVVYEKILEQLKLNHIITDNNNESVHEKCKNVTTKHILMFLKELKLNKYYEDYIYIYHYLTGKKINIISPNIEKKIINDFEILLCAYDKYCKNNETNRKSFINSQYVLIQLLLKHKIPCELDCSSILKTNDRRRFHDQICKEIFKQLGWYFNCIF